MAVNNFQNRSSAQKIPDGRGFMDRSPVMNGPALAGLPEEFHFPDFQADMV